VCQLLLCVDGIHAQTNFGIIFFVIIMSVYSLYELYARVRVCVRVCYGCHSMTNTDDKILCNLFLFNMNVVHKYTIVK